MKMRSASSVVNMSDQEVPLVLLSCHNILRKYNISKVTGCCLTL